MERYREPAVEFDAEQWKPIDNFEMPVPPVPSSKLRTRRDWPWSRNRHYEIKTVCGWRRLRPNDWIIRHDDGSYYPVPPKVFAANFQRAKVHLPRSSPPEPVASEEST